CLPRARTCLESTAGVGAAPGISPYLCAQDAAVCKSRCSCCPSGVADPTPFHVQAEVTLKTNFFASREMVCNELLPLTEPHGNVRAFASCSQGQQQKFHSDTIPKEQLNGVHEKEARMLNEKKKFDRILNAHCPRGLKTDLVGLNGPKTPDEGAQNAVHLAVLPSEIDRLHGQLVDLLKCHTKIFQNNSYSEIGIV
uniref:Uncharacterized protein n=1 Tax=Chelydra serpentina TaxID=8475 RepID=A0A8C3T8R5_CHESE